MERHAAKLRLMRRDPPFCVYCPVRLYYPHRKGLKNSEQATLEHIEPVSLGGSNDDDNLVLACKPCNSRRGNAPFLIMFCERMAA